MKLSPRSKAAMVDLTSLNDSPVQGEQPKRHMMGTAPGQAMQNIVLREELALWEGATPVRSLDPTTIVRSKWANRHEASFTDKAFASLKADIESAGGNVQPIKVRPLKGESGKYEVVFGHRRHQACLELGVQVLAMIGDVSEQDLFIEMDRENRQRKDLRPYEQGLIYAKALDAGLFSSARKLAESAGVDHSNLGKSLSLARLPTEVLQAFDSPLDIQLGWATILTQALVKDPEQVLSRAKNIQKLSPRPKPKKILDQLVGVWFETTPSGNDIKNEIDIPNREGVVSNHTPKKPLSFKGKAGQTGQISFHDDGRSIVIDLKNIDSARIEELQKLIRKFIS